MADMFQNLYIHVPFCRKKCAYCAFYSESGAERDVMERWLDKICGDLKSYSACLHDVHTAYFGGGTPSILPPDLMEKLFAAVSDSVRFIPGAEITMEANPETVTPEVCAAASGFINRVSMGVQSFSPEHLAAAGRHAVPGAVENALELWHRAGIRNCGIDLIYALPGQTVKDFEADLARAVSLDIRHISAYSLTVEEGTPLAESGFETDENLSSEMWNLAGGFLSARGFPRYEISNYAPEHFQAKHNQNIWHGETYLGLGPAASGFDGTDRYTQQESLSRWLAGEPPEEDVIPRGTRLKEIFLMGLRTVRGWRRQEFSACTGSDCNFPELAELEKEGLLVITPEEIRPAEKGLAFWNEIALRLL